MRLTIEEIIVIEPEVGIILREAGGPRHRREQIFDLFGWYRAQLSRLVGWYSPHAELQDPAQYETVIKALCEALDL